MGEDWLRDVVTYWREEYDWRAEERRLNAIPQVTAEIDGVRVHAAHLRAQPGQRGAHAATFRTWPGWMTEVRLSPLAESRVFRLTLWRAAMWERVSPRWTV